MYESVDYAAKLRARAEHAISHQRRTVELEIERRKRSALDTMCAVAQATSATLAASAIAMSRDTQSRTTRVLRLLHDELAADRLAQAAKAAGERPGDRLAAAAQALGERNLSQRSNVWPRP